MNCVPRCSRRAHAGSNRQRISRHARGRPRIVASPPNGYASCCSRAAAARACCPSSSSRIRPSRSRSPSTGTTTGHQPVKCGGSWATAWGRLTSGRMPPGWRAGFDRRARRCPTHGVEAARRLHRRRRAPGALASSAERRARVGRAGSRALRRWPAGSTPGREPLSSRRLDTFLGELDRSARPFDFSDCSVGNLVFAGSFLECGRRFNDAVADYCALLGLPEGLIENVTDGRTRSWWRSTAGPAGRQRRGDRRREAPGRRLGDLPGRPRARRGRATGRSTRRAPSGLRRGSRGTSRRWALNPRLLDRLRRADFVIYAPGTQHSSLFPSYLTPGVSEAIAGNHRAIKLLITNIQPDAEIVGQSAVDLIERALYYLNGKGAARCRCRP